MAVFGIADNRCAVNQIQQFPSFIRRCVVDDDDFEALEAMLGNGSQALQSQFCAIEEDEDDGNLRIVAARQAEWNFGRKAIVQACAVGGC